MEIFNPPFHITNVHKRGYWRMTPMGPIPRPTYALLDTCDVFEYSWYVFHYYTNVFSLEGKSWALFVLNLHESFVTLWLCFFYLCVLWPEYENFLHHPGIEPMPPAWQASILPLNQDFGQWILDFIDSLLVISLALLFYLCVLWPEYGLWTVNFGAAFIKVGLWTL